MEKGQFVCEYVGELISYEEGLRREADEDSVFRYFIKYEGKRWWYVIYFFGCLITDCHVSV